jgi:uncharacterized protein
MSEYVSRSTALVTGASTGLGLEFARLLARDKQDLILTARNAKKLQTLAKELTQKEGVKVTVIPSDLSRPGSAQELFQKVQKKKLNIDVLVNNAGVGVGGDFFKNDWTAESAMLQLNMISLTELTKLFLKGMVERQKGKILNIASTAAFQAGPGMALYYASKAYVVSFSEGIYEELKGTGVSVTAFCPGPTKTEFDKRAGMGSAALFKTPLVKEAPEVAAMGYRAMMAGKPLAFAGLANWFLSFTTRFAPRQFAAWLAGRLNR